MIHYKNLLIFGCEPKKQYHFFKRNILCISLTQFMTKKTKEMTKEIK